MFLQRRRIIDHVSNDSVDIVLLSWLLLLMLLLVWLLLLYVVTVVVVAGVFVHLLETFFTFSSHFPLFQICISKTGQNNEI